ncbi:MAG: hypothetical protein PHP22_10515 [Oscillospiraceae bacterium]|nr:hypothetical protein [Oscillospiraceae bacterium]
MKGRIKIFCALLAVALTVLCVQPASLQAASNIPESELAICGFAVDANMFESCFCLGKSSMTIKNKYGSPLFIITTRVWVLRDKVSINGNYSDVMLVWTQLEPQTFYLSNNPLTYKTYPESLKSTFFPQEFVGSSPKTQVVSTTYSLGADVGGDTSGFSGGISGSVSTQKNCLVIRNNSSAISDRSELFYDYRPGFILDNKFDYIGGVSEQIGMTSFRSTVSDYTISLNSTVNCGYTIGVVIYNGSYCTSGTQNRSFRTSFSAADDSTPDPIATGKVSYKTHVQDYGWQNYVSNGAVSGTSGESKRLEAIQIKLEDMSGSVQYRTHVQDIGWMSWVANDALSGTTGQSKRLEAIQISLTGDAAKVYDIHYSVHAQNMGWMDWAKNGESAGTSGFGYRLEAIKIVLVRKGGSAPGATARAFVQG